jgi:uncharacterized protein YbbC (DUF1343 family)
MIHGPLVKRARAFAAVSSAMVLATFVPVTPVSAQARTPGSGNVIPGVEVLLSDSLHLLRGKRVGLLTNHSGRDRQGTSTVDLLFKAPGVKLTALYGPEHGIRGEAKAGAKIADAIDEKTGVKVYSLYGAVETPTPDMLKDVDVLVYDIQDVGARVYTYQWTLALTAAAAGKPLVILDRPNPIRADRFEGNILDLKFRSLVGQHAVALRYGLTVGELMQYLVGTKALDAKVTVVPMKNYRRAMWYDETGMPRVNPSPNLRTLDAELLYPGTVFFEGTNATEGRGTDAPFQLIGADYLTDHVQVAAQLNALKLPGVRFDTATRTVEAGYKFGGKTIPMIKVSVTDRNAVRPVELGIRMLRVFKTAHPKAFAWREPSVNAAGRIKGIDRLAGTDQLTKAVDDGTIDALIARWNADATRFEAMVKPYLIYR